VEGAAELSTERDEGRSSWKLLRRDEERSALEALLFRVEIVTI
jgi:hypothetical protein